MPRGVCDVLGGLHAVLALLGALEHRRETGEGLLVEVPLAEAALNIAAEQTIEWTANGVLLERTGNRSFAAAPQGVYPCADEDSYVVLGVETDAHWDALKDGARPSRLGGRRPARRTRPAGMTRTTQSMRDSRIGYVIGRCSRPSSTWPRMGFRPRRPSTPAG